MPTSRLAVTAIMLVAACGDDWHAAPDGIHGGSRLRARFLVADDGAREFSGFHDSELDVDCYFSGDPLRCVPSSLATDVGWFKDPACSSRVVVLSTDPCATRPPFAGLYESSECSYDLTDVWTIGEQRAAGASIYVRAGDGSCVETELPSASAAFDLGEELPLDRFVGGHVEQVGADRLRTNVVVGDDGSREPGGAFDQQLGVGCWADTYTQRCLPLGAYASAYVDDACSVPIGRTSSCDPEPAFVQQWTFGNCTEQVDIYEVAAAVVPTELWDTSGDLCTPVAVDPVDYWAVGDPVPDDAMAFVQATLIGTGRLQMRFLAGDGAFLDRTWGFHDTQIDADCNAYAIGDDEFRCVPGNPGWINEVFYADAACTDPVRTIQTDGSCEGPPPVPEFAIAWLEEASCGSTAHRYAVGGEVTSGTIYQQDLVECTPTTWDPAVLRRWYLGDEIGFDDYALLRLITD